jgi:hypothetical protein
VIVKIFVATKTSTTALNLVFFPFVEAFVEQRSHLVSVLPSVIDVVDRVELSLEHLAEVVKILIDVVVSDERVPCFSEILVGEL